MQNVLAQFVRQHARNRSRKRSNDRHYDPTVEKIAKRLDLVELDRPLLDDLEGDPDAPEARQKG